MKKFSELIKRQTLVIAEIGLNHNGDLRTALNLIEKAAQAGADGVKFQAFKAVQLVSRHSPTLKHTAGNFFEQMQFLEIKPAWWKELHAAARKQNLLFGVSIFDQQSLQELRKEELDFVKIASSEIDNFQLLDRLTEFRVPFVVSTGMTYLSEVLGTVDFLRKKGVSEIVLLECTSLYPARAEQIFLKNIPFFRSFFELEAGLSDHSAGISLALAAVALGARMIEKHFTFDQGADGPDHKLSADYFQLKKMVEAIREIEKANQANRKEFLLKEEEEMRLLSRRSCVAAFDLWAGQHISPEMITFKRPGLGISPKEFRFILNKKLKRDIPQDYWICWDDIE